MSRFHGVVVAKVTHSIIVKSQFVSPSPGVLQILDLPKSVAGTLRNTLVDDVGNVYASGYERHPQNKTFIPFIIKWSRSLQIDWKITMETSYKTIPAIVLSSNGTMFSAMTLPTNQSHSELVLREIDTGTGNFTATSLIDIIYPTKESIVHCFLASAEQPGDFVYITYVMQDNGSSSNARTKLVKMSKVQIGQLSKSWERGLTEVGRNVISSDFAEDLPNGGVIVAEVSELPNTNLPLKLTVYAVDRNGRLTMKADTSISALAMIGSVSVGQTGRIYIAEHPTKLHSFSLINTNRRDTLRKEWTVTLGRVEDIRVVNDSDRVCILSHVNSFSNVGSTPVRAETPEIACYNYSGSLTYKYTYSELLPDVERRFHSFSSLPGINFSTIILGGVTISKREISDSAGIAVDLLPPIGALGLFSFPRRRKESNNSNLDNPAEVPTEDENRHPKGDKVHIVLLVLGGGVVVSLLFGLFVLRLHSYYKSNAVTTIRAPDPHLDPNPL